MCSAYTFQEEDAYMAEMVVNLISPDDKDYDNIKKVATS